MTLRFEPWRARTAVDNDPAKRFSVDAEELAPENASAAVKSLPFILTAELASYFRRRFRDCWRGISRSHRFSLGFYHSRRQSRCQLRKRKKHDRDHTEFYHVELNRAES